MDEGNLVPKVFALGDKNPGRGWSRDSSNFDCFRGGLEGWGRGQGIIIHAYADRDLFLQL